jgi:formyl-CoA transferase
MEVMAVSQLYSSIYAQFGRPPARRGSNLVRAKDGWVSPGLETGVQESTWLKVCELIGKPELVNDSRFITQESRRANQDSLLVVISEWAGRKPKEEIYHTLQSLRTITGYVATVEDLLMSQQFVDREFFKLVEGESLPNTIQPGAPYRIGDNSWEISQAPRLGEHNEEILCQGLGYSMTELGLEVS